MLLSQALFLGRKYTRFFRNLKEFKVKCQFSFHRHLFWLETVIYQILFSCLILKINFKKKKSQKETKNHHAGSVKSSLSSFPQCYLACGATSSLGQEQTCLFCCRPTPDKGFCSVRYWPFSGKEEWLPTHLFLLQHQPPTPVTFKQNRETAKQRQHTAPERGFLVLVSDTEIIPQKRTSPQGSPQSELKGLDFYFFLHFPHEYTAIGQFPS